MKRRDFVKQAGAAGMALKLAGAAQAEPNAQKKPNVLLIFSDQQHWQALGFMDPFFQTPHLDRLAADSFVFERSFCTTPQCSPSRSSLLTGFYPSTTRVMGNIGAAGGAPLEQPTLAPDMQAAGYRTGYFGKWHLGEKAIACGGWTQKTFKTHDPTAREKALEFLRDPATREKPFALVVSINNPHDIYGFKRHEGGDNTTPLPPSWERETFQDKPPVQQQFMDEDQGKVIVGHPKSEWQRYRDCYKTKNRLFDDDVGIILEELKQQGQWDNTIVIVTSDHGDMDAQHKLIFKGPFMYEHMMRIPLMIRIPPQLATTEPRRVTDIDVVNVDIVPTLRELCGLAPRKTDGISLAPILQGTGNYEPREFVIGQYFSKQRWANPIRTIRTADYKLNRYIRWGDELYDLKRDPHELKNVAHEPRYANIKRELERKLDQWIKEHDDPFYSLEVTTRRGEKL